MLGSYTRDLFVDLQVASIQRLLKIIWSQNVVRRSLIYLIKFIIRFHLIWFHISIYENLVYLFFPPQVKFLKSVTISEMLPFRDRNRRSEVNLKSFKEMKATLLTSKIQFLTDIFSFFQRRKAEKSRNSQSTYPQNKRVQICSQFQGRLWKQEPELI